MTDKRVVNFVASKEVDSSSDIWPSRKALKVLCRIYTWFRFIIS